MREIHQRYTPFHYSAIMLYEQNQPHTTSTCNTYNNGIPWHECLWH